MMDRIEAPVGYGSVVWRTREEGGRSSGPPTALVYAATAVFVMGEDEDVQPGWPASADALSIVLERVDQGGLIGRYKVDFLVRELALPYLSVGSDILIMEGPRVVGSLRIDELCDANP